MNRLGVIAVTIGIEIADEESLRALEHAATRGAAYAIMAELSRPAVFNVTSDAQELRIGMDPPIACDGCLLDPGKCPGTLRDCSGPHAGVDPSILEDGT